jgi:hypothetical protein
MGHPMSEGVIHESIIHQKHHEPVLSFMEQHLIQLVETTPAKNDLRNHFKITIIHFSHISAS